MRPVLDLRVLSYMGSMRQAANSRWRLAVLVRNPRLQMAGLVPKSLSVVRSKKELNTLPSLKNLFKSHASSKSNKVSPYTFNKSYEYEHNMYTLGLHKYSFALNVRSFYKPHLTLVFHYDDKVTDTLFECGVGVNDVEGQFVDEVSAWGKGCLNIECIGEQLTQINSLAPTSSTLVNEDVYFSNTLVVKEQGVKSRFDTKAKQRANTALKLSSCASVGYIFI